MRQDGRNPFEALLWGEVLLFGLLGAGLAFFVAYPGLRPTYELPQLRLVLQTVITLAAAIVAVLAATQFAVNRKRLDLLLASGFTVAAGSTFAFSIVPVLGGQPLHRAEAWAGIGGGGGAGRPGSGGGLCPRGGGVAPRAGGGAGRLPLAR